MRDNSTRGYFIVLDFIIFILYALLTLFLVMNHEPWRDEAQSWLVVRDTGLWDFLTYHVRWQGHPFLWYLIIFPFAKSGAGIFTQQLVNWLLAVMAVAVFMLKSPFPRGARYIFIFSYYMFFEYAVVSRNYALTTLLIFLIAALYQDRFKRPILYAFLLFLLFNAHYFVFALGLALGALFIKESRDNFLTINQRAGACFLIGMGALLAFVQGYFIPEGHYSAGLVTEPKLSFALEALSRSFIPATWDVSNWLSRVIAFVILVMSFISFFKNRSILWVAGLSLSWIFYIFVFRYPGDTRHFGLIVILLMFLFWMQKMLTPSPVLWEIEKKLNFDFGRTAFLFLCLCLMLSIRYSVSTGFLEITKLFSGSKQMAQAIEEISGRFSWQDQVIVAHPAPAASTVAAYLPKRKFWYADIEEYGTYIVSTEKLEQDLNLPQDQLVIRAGTKFQDISNVLFLLSQPLVFSEAFGHEFKLLYAIDKNVWGYGNEKYYLYKAVPKQGTGS